VTTSIEAAGVPGERTRRTALVVTVPAAEPLVASFRQRFDAASVARRIVPHVTILFPFVPLDELDDAVYSVLRSHFIAQRAFDALLDGVESFSGHVWLRPEPRERFVDLIEAACSVSPGTPPYEGVFDDHVPHLTIGTADESAPLESILETAIREFESRLPVRFRVAEVTLFEEQADDTWAAGSRFPLG
jgi:2'-5' RNA ligase